MKCPSCEDVDLSIAERKNVEIDFCPKCLGVWLDKGELDKIIELSIEKPGKEYREPRHEQREPRQESREHKHKEYSGKHYHKGHHHKRKKESFLLELFDFE